MTAEEIAQMLREWEHPASLEAPEGDDDGAAIDGVEPLPLLSISELRGC